MSANSQPSAVYGGVRKLQDYAGESTIRKLRRALRVGDMILTADGTESVRPIVVFQNRFSSIYPPASRKFTHITIYVGEGHIVHSTPDQKLDELFAGGVERILLEDLFSDGMTFTVLRYPRMTEAHYEAMNDAIENHIGKPYDYIGILRCVGFLAPAPAKWAWKSLALLPRLLWTSENITSVETARAFVCSDFVHAVYDEMFQAKNPCNTRNGYAAPIRMPCEFYANPHFVDVDIDAA